MTKTVFTFLLFSLFLAGCGLGGGGFELPPTRPMGKISGVVNDNLIRNSTVRIFEIQNAEKGALLAEGKTDENGQFSVDIRAKTQMVLVEATGGAYVEPASGVEVALGDDDNLRAIALYTSGESGHVTVTPLTHAVSALTLYYIAQGTDDISSFHTALSQINTLFTFSVTQTVPSSVNMAADPGADLTSAKLYGFYLAAISSLTEWINQQNNSQPHTPYSSIYFSQLMYRDILADGLLDGVGTNQSGSASVNLSLGTIAMSADTYRIKLAQHLLAVANRSVINKTGLTARDLLATATELAASRSPLFGNIAPGPFGDEPPAIYALDETQQYFNGTFEFNVAIGGLVGADRVLFYVNDDTDFIAEAFDPYRPSATIDSRQYADGEISIRVEAIDVHGNHASKTFTRKIDNSAPFANVTSKPITNSATFQLSGTYEDNGVGIDSIEVNQQLATLNEDGTWHADAELVPGQNDLTILMQDSLGNAREVSQNVVLDVLAPQFVDQPHSSANFTTGESAIMRTLEDQNENEPLLIHSNQTELNGIAIEKDDLNANTIPFFAFDVADFYFADNAADKSSLTVQTQYQINGVAVNDWRTLSPLETGYVVPLAAETLSSEWDQTTPDDLHQLRIKLTDEAGNITEKVFTFKVDFRVPALTVSATPLAEITLADYSQAGFTRRHELSETEFDTTSYEFTNNTGKAFYIAPGDPRTHSVQRTYDEMTRINKVIWNKETVWRLGPIKNSFIFSECPVIAESDWIELRHDSTDFNGVYNYVGNGKRRAADDWKYMPVPEPFVDDENPEQVFSDSPQDYASDWSDAPHFDETLALLSGSIFNNRVLVYFYDYILSLDLISRPGYIGGWQLLDDAASVVKTCPEARYFQQKFLYSSPTPALDENGEPYPKNIFTGNLTEPLIEFTGATFTVVDKEAGPIIADEGWYRIPAGHAVTIVKTIATPTIQSYEDGDVTEPEAFSSYQPHRYDRSFTWRIDNGLQITAIHDSGRDNRERMHRTESQVDVEATVFTLAR